jgi:hypothetical protein
MISRREKTYGLTHSSSISNLTLQVTLHFNVLFSLMFTVLVSVCSYNKWFYYNKMVSFLSIAVWFLFEIVRLYYGVRGNMTESVSEMSAYILITIFPQIPFSLYIAYIQPIVYPSDAVLGTLMFLILLFQIYSGISTTRRLIRNQTAQFMRLCDAD